MIKIEELKVCATINRAASVKKDKKGASYLSCGVVFFFSCLNHMETALSEL